MLAATALPTNFESGSRVDDRGARPTCLHALACDSVIGGGPRTPHAATAHDSSTAPVQSDAPALFARPSTAVALPDTLRLLSAEEMVPWHMRGWWGRALQPAAVLRPPFVRCEPPSLTSILSSCVLFATAVRALASPEAKARRWRLALVLVLVAMPMAAALQDVRPHEQASDGREMGFDAAPLNASMVTSHVTRRLAVIHLQPGANLQTEVTNANPGDELVLGDGTYTGSGTAQQGDNMLYINKDITIRALNPGQVVLDGQNARRVIYIASGNVVLEGLDITRGSATYVRARQPPLLPIGDVWNGPSKLSDRPSLFPGY